MPVIAMTALTHWQENGKNARAKRHELNTSPNPSVYERELYELDQPPWLIIFLIQDVKGLATVMEAVNDGYKYISLDYMKEISKGNRKHR